MSYRLFISIRRLSLIGLALTAFIAVGSSHLALGSTVAVTESITVSAGQSLLIPATGRITRIAIADPELADALPIEGKSLYLLGKKTGRTTVMLWLEAASTPQTFSLRIDRDVTELREQLQALIPEETRLDVTASGDRIILAGTLVNPLNAKRVIDIASQFAGVEKLLTTLHQAPPPQVLLEVKVAEISKTLIDRLGARINLVSDGNRTTSFLGAFLSGSAATLTTVSGGETLSLDLEERKGLIKILAEPSILALSGEQGEFLAGGKIFIPVAQFAAGPSAAGGISLEEREFGVGVKFLPTVLADGRINLKLTAEVSEVSTAGTAVSASGITSAVLPTISSRKTSTTVQLVDGQSFAIGGLSKDNVKGTSAGLPGLSSIPILGALFRSSDFQNDRSELVFVITAKIVKESAPVKLPTDGFESSSRSERILGGKLDNSSD